LPIKNKADGFITTPISDYRENGRAVNLKISFDSKGALVAECLELLSGSLNVEEKNILQSLTPDESRQRWVDLTSRGLPGSIMKDLIFSDINSDIDPFRVSYRLELPDFIKSEDTRLFIPLDILGRWQFDIAFRKTDACQSSSAVLIVNKNKFKSIFPRVFAWNTYRIISILTVTWEKFSRWWW
jgi:hypothetical protein